jgi:hypothetical protein
MLTTLLLTVGVILLLFAGFLFGILWAIRALIRLCGG